MSNATVGPGVTIQDIELSLLEDYVNQSARVFWMYDYLQTLPMEIHTIWMKKFTGVSLIFLVNRYLLLASIIAELYANAPGYASSTSCSFWHHLYYACGIITVMTTSAILTMRVYALYNRNRWIIVIASMLVLARLGVDLWTVVKAIRQTGSTGYGSLGLRCGSEVSANLHTFNAMQLTTDSLALAFDTFVFVLTLKKTVRHVHEMRQIAQEGIAHILLRDGIIYFLRVFQPSLRVTQLLKNVYHTFRLVFLMTAIDMSLHIATIVGGDNSYSGYAFTAIMSAYCDYTPNLLVNRLVLNLREYSTQHRIVYTDEIGTIPKLTFTNAEGRILGNIGAPLDHGRWKDSIGWVDLAESETARGSYEGAAPSKSRGSEITTHRGSSKNEYEPSINGYEMELLPRSGQTGS